MTYKVSINWLLDYFNTYCGYFYFYLEYPIFIIDIGIWVLNWLLVDEKCLFGRLKCDLCVELFILPKIVDFLLTES